MAGKWPAMGNKPLLVTPFLVIPLDRRQEMNTVAYRSSFEMIPARSICKGNCRYKLPLLKTKELMRKKGNSARGDLTDT
jgi:hypothetical protein